MQHTTAIRRGRHGAPLAARSGRGASWLTASGGAGSANSAARPAGSARTPTREPPRGQRADERVPRSGTQAPDVVLPALHPRELPAVRGGERAVAPQRLLMALRAAEHRGELAPRGDPEVERGADALGAERQAVAGGVADEEHAVLGRRAQRVRDPVALVAERLGAEVLGQPHGRLLDVVARVERADADPDLVARGERPAVARAHVALVDPQLEVLGLTAGVDLQPAREQRLGRLDVVLARRARGASRARRPAAARRRRRGRCGWWCRCGRRPSRSRTRPPTAPTAARTGAGSRRSRTPSRSASGRWSRACGRPASRRSGGSNPRARGCAATAVGAAHAEVWRSPIS